MKRFLQLALGLVLCAAPLVAQNPAPDIAFDSNADLLKLPDNIHMGEAAGVATNSKGHIFVYTRTGTMTATLGGSRVFTHGGSRLLEFDQNGAYVKEIGVGIYGFLQAHVVRVDPQDNLWVVDEAANLEAAVFDGRILVVIQGAHDAAAVQSAIDTH